MRRMSAVFMIAGLLGASLCAQAAENQGAALTDIIASKVIERTVPQGFSAEEKDVIKQFFGVKDADGESQHGHGHGHGKKHKGLPPGLAKKDHLPPGLQKQLERNGHLPPGLEKRDIPADLRSKLPSCHKKRSQCVIVGDDVALIEKGTDLILDVIQQAISH